MLCCVAALATFGTAGKLLVELWYDEFVLLLLARKMRYDT